MSTLMIESNEVVVDAEREREVSRPSHPPILRVHSFGLTDQGQIRSSNQDQFLVATLTEALQIEQTSLPQPKVRPSKNEGHLFVVADGMAGHPGGEQLHLEPGDVMLLCTDGLTEMLPEADIARILRSVSDPEFTCRRLVQCANKAGGKDNITVIVAHYEHA